MKPNNANGSIDPQQLTPELIAGILTAIQNQQAQTKANPLVDLLTEEFSERKNEKDEEKRILVEAKKQNSLAMESRRKAEIAGQDFCPHIKPNRESHVICQRDHSNNYHYFCQKCQKHWLNGELPSYLAIDPAWIGGPQL